MNLADLQAKDVEELRELAAEHGVEGYEELEHSDLVLKLLDVVPLAPSQSRAERTGSPGSPTGILEIVDEGFGFLRAPRRHAVAAHDIYVSSSQVRRFGLRTGDKVDGPDPPSRRTRRSTGACCASTRSTASTRRSPSAARTSTRWCRSSPTRCSTSRPTRRT